MQSPFQVRGNFGSVLLHAAALQTDPRLMGHSLVRCRTPRTFNLSESQGMLKCVSPGIMSRSREAEGISSRLVLAWFQLR
jgi:hypothetical protein